MSTGWLRCRIYQGMFSDELGVQYPLEENAPAYFVPKDKVKREHDGVGRVSVQFFSSGSTYWAILPTEDQRAVPIREGDPMAT